MKCFLILAVFFLTTYANVTNNGTFDKTTKQSVDLEKENIETVRNKIQANNQFEEKHRGYKYYDDIVLTLKRQNWTKEEIPCLNETLKLIASVQNFTSWAVWEWDSMSIQPMALLSGTGHMLGNFDQCLESPWRTHHPEIKSQYCLANVALEPRDKIHRKKLDEIEPYGSAVDLIQHNTTYHRPLKYVTWGLCVPSTCGSKSVERLAEAIIEQTYLGTEVLRPRIKVDEACQSLDNPYEYPASLYVYTCIVAAIFLMIIACTVLNERVEEDESCIKAICKACSLVENSRRLMKVNKDGFEIISGMKYLSVTVVVVCHFCPMIVGGPLMNGITADGGQLTISWLVSHNDVVVDTFLFISGFLLTKNLMEYKKLPPILIIILKRYVRLTAGLVVVMSFMAIVFEHTGTGPLWNRFTLAEAEVCRNYWWVNLLMINNYLPMEKTCIVVTWYVPVDFHLFLVTVILFAIYERSPRVAKIIGAVLAAASIIVPGVISYIHNFHPIQIFDYEFYVNPRGSESFRTFYTKSHNRASSYMIGVVVAALYHKYKTKGTIKLSQSKSTLYTCGAIALMLFVTVNGVAYQHRSNFSQIEGHLFAALNRPLWAIGVAILMLTCVYGHVPLVPGFLKWQPWVPLSRLAYGVYLIHFLVVIRYVANVRSPEFYSHFNTPVTAIGVLVFTTFLSYVMWLFFEAPVNNLLSVLLKRMLPNENGKTTIESNTTNKDVKEGA